MPILLTIQLEDTLTTEATHNTLQPHITQITQKIINKEEVITTHMHPLVINKIIFI